MYVNIQFTIISNKPIRITPFPLGDVTIEELQRLNGRFGPKKNSYNVEDEILENEKQ